MNAVAHNWGRVQAVHMIMADLTGLSFSMISKLEQGQRSFETSKVKRCLARLDVETEWISEVDDAPKRVAKGDRLALVPATNWSDGRTLLVDVPGLGRSLMECKRINGVECVRRLGTAEVAIFSPDVHDVLARVSHLIRDEF